MGVERDREEGREGEKGEKVEERKSEVRGREGRGREVERKTDSQIPYRDGCHGYGWGGVD